MFCCWAGCAQPGTPLYDRQVIDLTYAFDETTVYWPTETGFTFEKGFEGVTDKGYFYAANSFAAPEHGGTHIDAPIHFFEEGHAVDAIPVKQLIGPGVVIDVNTACAENRDYLVRQSDFEAWEQEQGRQIPQGAIVLLRTGFGNSWPDRVRYMGTDERGVDAVAKLHFPGLDPDAATWLAEQRSIGAIGLDTPSIDRGQSELFQSHVRLFENNIPALENVANLDRLPLAGFTVIALPMKIKGGSGGPARIVAVLD